MTNHLVGDVYAKIIDQVIAASANEFEEAGVSSATLAELQQEWQAKLSARGVAAMPWDPAPPAPHPHPHHPPSAAAAAAAAVASAAHVNGLPPPAFAHPYDPAAAAARGTRIKPEPGSEPHPHGLPTAAPYAPNGHAAPTMAQGGAARAQQLLQQQYGSAANASVSAMQRGALALPAPHRPPAIPLPAGSPAQQQFQQQQQAAMQRQQQQLQRQQSHPRIKVETDSPQPQPGSFDQQRRPNYSQTDGADEHMHQWRALLADRRAAHVRQGQQADRLMRDHVARLSDRLQSGLMLPLAEHASPSAKKPPSAHPTAVGPWPSTLPPPIPQLDGEAGGHDEKPPLRGDDDENAINSDLDDSDDDGAGAMGDDDDDLGDTILCTYDKVQRVKNKWKCTLKDGVMSVNGKEWVFHKGMGEFEW